MRGWRPEGRRYKSMIQMQERDSTNRLDEFGF